jgi:hypothetical protein
MKLLGLSTPKPRSYSYKPVFYDPVKDDQDKRLTDPDIKKDGLYESELRMRMRLRMNRRKLDERVRKKSRIMGLLFTLLLLFLALYFIFFK